MSTISIILAGVLATSQFQTAPVRTMSGADAWPWTRVETYQDLDAHFVQEPYEPDDIDLSANDVRAFGGDDTPHSKEFLLHYGARWDTNPRAVPVLLIPGAIRSASILWHDARGDGTQGLAPHLIGQGFRVFGLTWGYNSGDNFLQAEQIANAIARVRAVTGQPRVDLVTISKGGLPTRIYLSRLPGDWRTAYRGDVRRALFLGCPNLGVDALFRHPIYGMGLGALMPWDRMLTSLGWTDTTEDSLYNLARFAGHAQMLHRWDLVYPIASFEPDWWTTYYGGWGFMSHSRGLVEARRVAGDVIDRLEAAGLDPGVELAVLAGSKPYLFANGGVAVEYQGPSDVAVFLRSALHTDGMTRNGARLIRKSTLFLNHNELYLHPLAHEWVEDTLGWGEVEENTTRAAQVAVGLGAGGAGRFGLTSEASLSTFSWRTFPWVSYDGAVGETRPALGDVDGDGRAEMVVGLGRYPSSGGWLAVYDDEEAGAALMRWVRVPWSAYDSANGETWPACGDIDRDGRDEVLAGLGAGGLGRCAVFEDASGSFAFRRWLAYPSQAYAQANGGVRPAAGDWDGDGADEVALAPTGAPGSGWVVVIEPDGSGARWVRFGWTAYDAANGEVWPAMGDVDGDGRAELLLGQGRYAGGGYVQVRDDAAGNGAPLAWIRVPWAQYDSLAGETRPAAGSIDVDGAAEVLVGLGRGGAGWFLSFDDGGGSFRLLGWNRAGAGAYAAANGETRVAIAPWR